MPLRVAVTAGYSRSLHAIALLHELQTRGCEVVLGLEVSALQWRRLRGYLRQIGMRKLAAKVRAKLGGPGPGGNFAGEVAPMAAFLRERGIKSRSVAAACRRVRARYVRVSSLNGAAAIRALRKAAIDLVVYGGGGIVRGEFLQTPRLGVLNAHGGPLPRFRGMNAAEWALLHAVAPTVTVHFMDAGIDTGPILLERPIPAVAWTSIAGGRGAATRVGVEALLEAVERIAAGGGLAMPQEAEAGRLYHVMAEPLLEVLEYRTAVARSRRTDSVWM